MNIHAITVYPFQNRLLVIEYSDSSVAATLHSSAESLHLIHCSKPSSQLPGCFQLSQINVLCGGFWAWGIKTNRTEPSHSCTVGGEAWYNVEPKIPSQRMMCHLVRSRVEGTTLNPRGRNTLPFKGEKASTWSITGGPHYFSCHWLFGPPTSEPRILAGKELACTTVIVTDSKQPH